MMSRWDTKEAVSLIKSEEVTVIGGSVHLDILFTRPV